MLVTKRALGPLPARPARGAPTPPRELAEAHRDTPIIGRTLLQQARADDVRPEGRGLDAGPRRGRRPTSARVRLSRAARRAGRHARARCRALRARARPRRAGASRGTRCAGGSASSRARSASPPARSARPRATSRCSPRPRSARSARAAAAARPACRTSTTRSPRSPRSAARSRRPGYVATLLAAMVQEHERAAGAWHSEWRPLCDLLITVGSAAAWLRDSLEGLEVDAERMRANLGDAATRHRRRRPLVDRALEAPMIPHHVVTGPAGRAGARPLELARHHARDVGPAGRRARRALPARPLRHARPRRLGHAARPVLDRRRRRRRRRAARPPRRRARALRRALARRHDRRCGSASTRRSAIDRLVLLCTSPQLGPAQRWADRAATVREQGTQRDRRRDAGALADRRTTAPTPRHRRGCATMFTGIDDEGYANCCAIIERMDLTAGPAADRRADAGDRAARRTRRRRREHAAQDRRGDPGRAAGGPRPRRAPDQRRAARTRSPRLIVEHLEA